MSWFRKKIKKPNPIAKELVSDPRYRHLVHRSKDEVLQKQLEEEGRQEIREFLDGSKKIQK